MVTRRPPTALDIIEARARIEHSAHQRQVAPRGASGDYQSSCVKSVLSRVLVNPAKRAAAVLDRCGRERHAGQPILHIDHIHSPAKIGQRTKCGGVFAATYPTTAMKKYQRRSRFEIRTGRDHVELH